MKKSYSKPTISFEDFKMSTSIANNCYYKGNQGDMTSCFVDIGIGVIFASSAAGCQYISSTGDGFGVCYDNPSDMLRVFTS